MADKKLRTEVAMKTYVLDMKSGGQRKVTVPAAWKVTFGPLVPGTRDGNGNSNLCLRFYESANQQRAVFANVVAFRDESIQILEKVTRKQAQTVYRDAPGGRKSFVVEAHASSWQNPDAPEVPDDEFLALPGAEATHE